MKTTAVNANILFLMRVGISSAENAVTERQAMVWRKFRNTSNAMESVMLQWWVAQVLISTHRFSFSVGPTLAATTLKVLVMASLGNFGNTFFNASTMPIFVRSLPSISALNADNCSGGIMRFVFAGFDAVPEGVCCGVLNVFSRPFMVRCVSGARGGFIEPLPETSLDVVEVATASDGSGVQYAVANGSIACGCGSNFGQLDLLAAASVKTYEVRSPWRIPGSLCRWLRNHRSV